MSPWGAPAEISRRQVELSDVTSFHFYGDRDGLRGQIETYKKHLRPVINTEWMARPKGSKWEIDLPLFKEEAVGSYSWGLVNGRTQCQFAWYHKRGTPEPKVWFHDLFHANGRPYDAAEHAAIRQITADKKIDWAAADYTKPQTKPGLPAHSEDGIRFSDGWTRWTGGGPQKGRLHFAKDVGATATWTTTNTTVTLIHKVGPDCGLALALINGEPAPKAQFDTFSPTVDWGRRTVLATNLPPGRHIVSIVVLGKKNEQASDSYVQVVAFEQSPDGGKSASTKPTRNQ
jgi:hypothetical protein